MFKFVGKNSDVHNICYYDEKTQNLFMAINNNENVGKNSVKRINSKIELWIIGANNPYLKRNKKLIQLNFD